MKRLVMLTGFLGSGKTTLLKELMNAYSDTKIGVIVNEFGEINVDARLVEKDGVQMAELSNGSIFCACIKSKFVESLVAMSGWDIEILFIEASGLADPSNMGNILKDIKKQLTEPYDYRGDICVVDAENFIELYDLLPALLAQVQMADVVIVNKADLVDEKQINDVKEIITTNNKKAKMVITSYCKAEYRTMVEGMGIQFACACHNKDTVNTPESKAKTFNIMALDIVPLDSLREFLRATCESSYRIKGFINTDKGWKEISCVNKTININDWDEPEDDNMLVFISSVGIKAMGVITKAIKACGLKGIMRI